MATHVTLILNLMLVWMVRASIDSVLLEVEDELSPYEKETAAIHTQSHLIGPFENTSRPSKFRSRSWDASKRYQLDMIISTKEYVSMFERGDPIRKRRNAVLEEHLWPRTIPYEIDDTFNTSQQLTIVRAMLHIMQHTCIVFKDHHQEINYIKFVQSRRCESMVGMDRTEHKIRLADKCVTKPIVVHELLHALGLYHEHMRHNRNAYLTIHEPNITFGQEFQFLRMNENSYNDYGETYDYRSLMHYGKDFFGMQYNATHKKITMEPKQEGFLDVIGEAPGLSFYDIMVLNSMYKCAANCTQRTCASGQFLGKTCECYCQGPPDNAAVSCEAKCSLVNLDPVWYIVKTVPAYEALSLRGTPWVHSGQTIEVAFRGVMHWICGNPTHQRTCQHGIWDGTVELPCTKDRCRLDPTWYNKYHVNLTKKMDPILARQTQLPHNEFVDLVCPSNPAINATLMCNMGMWEWTGRINQCDSQCRLRKIHNGEIRVKGVLYTAPTINLGQKITVHCRKGYHIYPPAPKKQVFKTECQKGNVLKRSLPYCLRKINPVLERFTAADPVVEPPGIEPCHLTKIENGVIRMKGVIYTAPYINLGQKITVHCSKGYQIASKKRTFSKFKTKCQKGNVLKRPLPTCQRISPVVPAGSVECPSGRTIIETMMCDGKNDCGDHFDERNCDACQSGAFRCPSGQCISDEWVCDGFNTCGDNSDEKNCGSHVCQTGHVQCPSGKCIWDTHVCNGINDCGDNSDEQNCDTHVCPPKRVTCPSGLCIWSARVCDGRNDCGDNFDEQNCKAHKCPPRKVQCPSGKCIWASQVCNGKNTCGDNSDEQNCD